MGWVLAVSGGAKDAWHVMHARRVACHARRAAHIARCVHAVSFYQGFPWYKTVIRSLRPLFNETLVPFH
jgi:hypothetical protein